MAAKQNKDNDEVLQDIQSRMGNLHNDLPGEKGKQSDPPKNGGNGFYLVPLGQKPWKSDDNQFNVIPHKA